MKKTVILATVVALLMALMTGTAMAKGKGSGKGLKKERVTTYVFKGSITAVDSQSGVVTVAFDRGNKAARSVTQAEEEVEFGTNASTRINVGGQEGVGFGPLAADQEVNVQTRAKSGTPEVFVARRISAASPEAAEEEPIQEPGSAG
ncbi:hypothetical protein BH23ACT11_BH23ACT11_24420 [soil metagenome]